jgi:hypothetical protein
MPRALHPPEPPRLALSQQEAAQALGMSVNAFVEYVQSELPVVYVGSMRRYPVEGIAEWLARNSSRGGRRIRTR